VGGERGGSSSQAAAAGAAVVVFARKTKKSAAAAVAAAEVAAGRTQQQQEGHISRAPGPELQQKCLHTLPQNLGASSGTFVHSDSSDSVASSQVLR